MKVYFTSSIRWRDKYGGYYRKIVDLLRSLGYQVLGDEILTLSKNELMERIDKNNVREYKKFVKDIRKSDFVVTEVSGSATANVGFLISVALEMGKPVIALCMENDVPPLVKAIPSELFRFVEYTDDNLIRLLRLEVSEVSKLRTKRFTLLFQPKITSFLDEISKKGASRSEYIRNLILQDMRKLSTKKE